MRCLVTGASGFLGSSLIRGLLAHGEEVLCVVHSPGSVGRLSDLESRIQILASDLADIQQLQERLLQFQPDIIYHLAWAGGNSRRFVNDISQIYANVPGSLELVRMGAEAGCGAFIFLGSSVEYGTYNIPVRELDIAEPRNLYGWAKFGTMMLSKALCEQLRMRFCGVRLFWAYGPQDDELRMIPSVIQQLLRGKKPALTAGEQVWDFLYVDDAVKALIGLATTGSASGIFNLASGELHRIREVVELVRDYINPQLQVGFGEVEYAADQIMHLEPDVSRIKRAINWNPEVPLREGLRRTVEFYRSKIEHI